MHSVDCFLRAATVPKISVPLSLRCTTVGTVHPADTEAAQRRSATPRGIVLDMDLSVSPTHGEQQNLSITHNSAFLLRDGIWLVLELLESLVIHC